MDDRAPQLSSDIMGLYGCVFCKNSGPEISEPKKTRLDEENNFDARTSRLLALELICLPTNPSNVSAKRQNILLPRGSQHSCQTTVRLHWQARGS